MSQKKNGAATTVEYQFPQPKQKESFAEMIYNPKEGTILGRTPKNWGSLFIFYAIFYAVLAGLFAICMQGLFSTLSDTEPKWKLHESIIGTNPGLGFRPLPQETERGSVIQFDTKKPDEAKYWIGLLDEFLKPYQDQNGGKNQKICDFNTTIKGDQVCAIDIGSFNECTAKNGYGFLKGKPCIFLKLNKIYNWEPDYYDNINELPDDMPKDLVEHIKSLPLNERKQVWISCEGQHSLDLENIGTIKYESRGFPTYYYPYRNQPGYLSPLVAVQFEKVKINELVNVECRAWAKNIIYSGSIRDRKGSVSFQLFID